MKKLAGWLAVLPLAALANVHAKAASLQSYGAGATGFGCGAGAFAAGAGLVLSETGVGILLGVAGLTLMARFCL